MRDLPGGRLYAFEEGKVGLVGWLVRAWCTMSWIWGRSLEMLREERGYVDLK